MLNSGLLNGTVGNGIVVMFLSFLQPVCWTFNFASQNGTSTGITTKQADLERKCFKFPLSPDLNQWLVVGGGKKTKCHNFSSTAQTKQITLLCRHSCCLISSKLQFIPVALHAYTSSTALYTYIKHKSLLVCWVWGNTPVPFLYLKPPNKQYFAGIDFAINPSTVMVVAAHPDLAPLSHLLQFIQGDINPFPGQLRDVILTPRMRGASSLSDAQTT